MHTLQVLILLDLLNGKPQRYSTLTDNASSEDPVQWIDVLHHSENSESAEVHVMITEARDQSEYKIRETTDSGLGLHWLTDDSGPLAWTEVL